MIEPFILYIFSIYLFISFMLTYLVKSLYTGFIIFDIYSYIMGLSDFATRKMRLKASPCFSAISPAQSRHASASHAAHFAALLRRASMPKRG